MIDFRLNLARVILTPAFVFSLSAQKQIIFNVKRKRTENGENGEIPSDRLKSIKKNDKNPFFLTKNKASSRFLKVAGILKMDNFQQISIIAIVKHVDKLKITSAGGYYRFVTLCDDSSAEVTLALWGDNAEIFTFTMGNVLLVENAMVKTYNGMKQLSSMENTLIYQETDNDACKKLTRWWEKKPNTRFGRLFDNNADTLSIAQIRTKLNDNNGKNVFVIVQGTVTINQESIAYNACSACGKKVQTSEKGDAFWCDKCQKTVSQCNKYCLCLNLSDRYETARMTAFEDVCEKMFETDVDTLLLLKVCFYFRFSFYRRSLYLIDFLIFYSRYQIY